MMVKIIPKNLLVKGCTGSVQMRHSSVKAAKWETGPRKGLSGFRRDKAGRGRVRFAQVQVISSMASTVAPLREGPLMTQQ